MQASPNKPPVSANQKDALPSKNSSDQSANPFVRKNSTPHEKLKSDFLGNNNPDQVPAYMNAMKIVPSPTFNFDGNSGPELVHNANTQPKSNSQLQNSRSLEISDRIASPIPKISDKKAVKDEKNIESVPFQLNKSHSLPGSNESGQVEHDVHSDKNQENSTEGNSNTTPDDHEVSSIKNKLNTEPTPIVSSNREKASSVNKVLLDNDCSGIPLNIQMLKEKFKNQEAKIHKQEDKEEPKKSRPNNPDSSVERNNLKLKQEESKKEKVKSDNNNKADPYLQNANKSGDGQSNWLQKKFTEAALVKKDEPVKKASPHKKSIDTSEDGNMHHSTGQGIKVNTVKINNETDSQVNRSQTFTSPSKPPTPASQTEQPKKVFKMLQETVSQGQPDRNTHGQYFQMHDAQHRTQSPFMNDMNSLNVSQSEIVAPSRDPVNVSGLLDNSHLARMTNWPGNPHLDFSAQNWHGANPQEYQKKTLLIINFYEQHLNNFKTLIIQQTNVIEAQKFKITNIENLLKESNDKVKIFEEELYKQTMNHQKVYQELLEKYSETVSQLNRSQSDLEKALKKLGEIALQENEPIQTTHTATSMSPPRKQEKVQDNLNNLYQEIFSIKKDLNTQRKNKHLVKINVPREIMKEMRQSTPPKYENENRAEQLNRSKNSSTYEQAKDESESVHPLRTSYDRDHSGLQRNSASSSVPKLIGRRDKSNDTQYDEGGFRGRANRSAFANRAQLEENAQIANQSRQYAQGGRVRDLLNWQSPSKPSDSTFVSPTRTTIGFQGPLLSRVETEYENDTQNLTCDRNINRSTSTDAYRHSSTYIYGLSNQKPRRKNSEEVEKLQQIIRELYHEKKAVEDELLKIPENWKTLEQRRRKAKIEAEIERIEEKMEGYKSRMRELTVSPVKQRR